MRMHTDTHTCMHTDARAHTHMHTETMVIILLPPIGFRSRLGQRHGLQNTTLTSHFYKNI